MHCDTQEELVDAMTKPLKLNVFLKLQGLLGACIEIDINGVLVCHIQFN